MTDDWHRGDWMQTFTGRKFYPRDPFAADVCVEDIAHALSMQCRYAGHCLRFYSVAEHCVLMARSPALAGESLEIRLGALMHDAAEAYFVDIVRPVKRYLDGYLAMEKNAMRAICDQLRVPRWAVAHDLVKSADDRILNDEREQNMAPSPERWQGPQERLGVTLKFWTPAQAEAEFLRSFDELRPPMPDA